MMALYIISLFLFAARARSLFPRDRMGWLLADIKRRSVAFSVHVMEKIDRVAKKRHVAVGEIATGR
jgi:GTP1/Obg family GTP-binding protein